MWVGLRRTALCSLPSGSLVTRTSRKGRKSLFSVSVVKLMLRYMKFRSCKKGGLYISNTGPNHKGVFNVTKPVRWFEDGLRLKLCSPGVQISN